MKEDLLQVGAITSTHGIRGEVKVYPTTDDAARYKQLKAVIADNGRTRQELEIAGVRFFKNMVIVKFKGIDNINDVEQYKGAKLFISREDAVPLAEDEYFHADLIGLTAVTEEGETLGVVKDIITTGANDVYAIRPEAGRELLVPAIKDCIKRIDLEHGLMTIHLLPGLRELNER